MEGRKLGAASKLEKKMNQVMEKGKKLNGNSKGKKIRRGKRQNCHTSIIKYFGSFPTKIY